MLAFTATVLLRAFAANTSGEAAGICEFHGTVLFAFWLPVFCVRQDAETTVTYVPVLLVPYYGSAVLVS